MSIDALMNRRESLERTRTGLQGQLENILSDLDRLTDNVVHDPTAAEELVALEREAAALTGTITRLDATIEDADQQLTVAQAASNRARVLDAITAAAESAQTATEQEQVAYTALFAELGAVFTKISAARDDGARARSHLRGLIKAESPAFPALLYLGATSPAQEAAAERLEKELDARRIDVRPALEGRATLPYSRLLVPLLEAFERKQPLEDVA